MYTSKQIGGCSAHTVLRALLLALALGATESILANTAESIPAKPPFWDEVAYDSAIPTHQSVLGYTPGERITTYDDMLRFFDALALAAPDHIKILDYGRSWEGRRLIVAIIGTPERLANIEGYIESVTRITNPDLPNRGDDVRMGDLPASVWLQHGVHGNEISSTDAAMVTAYHLLAAPDLAQNQAILNNTLIFIDPLQNPDGRARFTSRYYATVGLTPSADPMSAEHNEPWPKGRSNHYLFDMNRDWLALTQPETQARVQVLNRFKPTIVIDLHEMDGDETYFFPPAPEPINPYMSQEQLENTRRIGQTIARRFDEQGIPYFTREVFDAFYPGYGDSWPTFYGASAATYEVGSARGDHYRQKNGRIKRYVDTIEQHVIASLATLEGAANHREAILDAFARYQLDAIQAGKKDKEERFFLLTEQQNRAGRHRLATLMAQHGVRVEQSTEAFSACGVDYAEGTYIIDTAQPRGRFVKTTLTQQVDMSAGFIAEQERRRARKLPDEMYDVTAWSLPLMFGVRTAGCGKQFKVATQPVRADMPLAGTLGNKANAIAFILPWGDAAAVRFVAAALTADLPLKSADKAFVLNGQRYPAGSVIVPNPHLQPGITETVAHLAAETGANLVGVNSSWVTEGPSFGSEHTVDLLAPKIALLWDEPVSSLSAGSTRFIIERQMGYPVTAVRAAEIDWARMTDYQVFILPDGDYGDTFSDEHTAKLKDWVANGGVLITLKGATAFAAQAGLLSTALEYKVQEDGASDEDKAADTPKLPGTVIPDRAALLTGLDKADMDPDWIAGALVTVDVDTEHWLAAGIPAQVVALANGDAIFKPLTLDAGQNVGTYGDPETLLASGHLWPESKKQLAFKPFWMIEPADRGFVIGFTQDPTQRAYLDGLQILLANSVFRGSAHASPIR
jgi:hypothetical protein